jgi:tetratricopeptide (TPR) repeat protein
MVIFELERELGRYIRKHPHEIVSSATGKDILQRVGTTSQLPSAELVGAIVENSYLGEALSLAVEASRGSADERHILSIRKLVEALEIYDIRNAVSHPNRLFPECYWYRCSAIAADPSIDALQFIEVSRVFQSALAGNLEEPPEEWLYQRQWVIPNCLPDEFEHSVTGLFGRSKDIARLYKELKNPKSTLIAVVARGGIGKTSLVLQALSDFCLSPESLPLSDGVVFVTLKQELLSHEGLQVLEAPATIEEVRNVLCDQIRLMLGVEISSFDECVQLASQRKLWLFIDNLETVLRDAPTSFIDFYDTLPSPWKVIVTSRIPVDGGKNIPIEALEEPGAFAFCRQYFESKGQPISDADLIQRIISGCQHNPLAIRLTIDSFLAGKDISESLLRTSEEVISFSFSNLLEALSENANNVLEGLFVIESPTRPELGDALKLDLDQVSAAIAELVRTSLILRSDTENGEVYSLGDSIRGLLRSNPRNRKVRAATIEWVQKTRASASEALKKQAEKKLSPVDILYVPNGTSPSFIPIPGQIVSACKARDLRGLSSLEGRIRSFLEGTPSSAFLHRLYARVLEELDDLPSAEKHLRKAVQIDENDPASKLALATLLQQTQQIDEAYKYCMELINSGWHEEANSGVKGSNNVWRIYLTILNFREDLDNVLAFTESWKEKNKVPSIFGVARASAYRRLAYKEKQGSDTQRLGELLTLAANNLSEVLSIDGPSRPVLSELKKLVGELEYCATRKSFDFSNASKKGLASFLIQNKPDILKYCECNFAGILDSLGGNISSSPSLLPQPPANKYEEQGALESKGYTVVRVNYLPKSDGFPSYVFAVDGHNNAYYLHVEAFENGNWREWVFVEKGTKLAIKYQANITGTAKKATEIKMVG